MEVQVNAAHYNFASYLDLKRWNSYYSQLSETLALSPKTVLYVGKGDDIVNTLLEKFGIKVYTFDFDAELQPDFIGDVQQIKEIIKKAGVDSKFDVLVCCQVLEHLPYESFEPVLQQFNDISDHVILSLPYSARPYTLEFNLPVVERVRLGFYMHKYHRKLKFNGEHYWEVGYEHYTKKKIGKSIKRFFDINRQFLPRHNDSHIFFVLHSKKTSL